MEDNKMLRNVLLGCLSVVLLVGSFSGGVLVGKFVPFGGSAPLSAPAVSPNASGSESTPEEMQTLFKPFWESWNLVHQYYVDQPVDDVKLMQGAISGMLASLGDQHTSYMNPQEYTDANASLSGEYEGIGAYVDTSGEFLTVISPIPGSPAEKAGIRAGDVFLKIDGEDITGIDPELVRRKVLGPAGSTVVLTIRREGVEEPIEISIVRARITIASVESKMLDGDIAYVKLNTFGDTTSTELREALETLMAQNPKGLILDLRNNGGGFLTTAIEVISEFIPEGEVVMYEQYGDGRRDEYKSSGGGLALDIPMVVLINEGSASASEIVAGTLQDYGRAQLVGVKSYGKGSVQNWIPLNDSQGAVRITIAKWLTPKERTIHQVGLEPDIEVKITEEDLNAQLDPQLDKAIEILSK